MDERKSTLQDSPVEVQAIGNPARYVNASGRMRAQVSYHVIGPASQFWKAFIGQAE